MIFSFFAEPIYAQIPHDLDVPVPPEGGEEPPYCDPTPAPSQQPPTVVTPKEETDPETTDTDVDKNDE